MLRIIFGQNVRKFRNRINLTQKDLSYKAKMQRTYITEIENGHRNVTLDLIEELANALEIEPYMLLTSKEEKNGK